jgi:two-component system phosphate regulon sensor histidine kinase PhoR
MVEVSVSDTGPGIPPQELSRIFERFYQIDKSRRGGSGHGIGLGLAIVRELIRAHHGSISAYNNSGQGSTFTVRLPSTLSNDSTLTKKKIKSSN